MNIDFDTNLPARVSVPTMRASFSEIFTSIVPSLWIPGGKPKAAIASVTRIRPR